MAAPSSFQAIQAMKFRQEQLYLENNKTKPFRFGYEKPSHKQELVKNKRRKQYGDAVRAQIERPRTADDYLGKRDVNIIFKNVKL